MYIRRIEPGDPTAAAAGSAGGGVRRSGDESGSRGGVVKTGKEKEKSLWEDSVSEWQEAMLLVQNVRELGADSGAASPSLVSPPGMYKTALQIFLNVSCFYLLLLGWVERWVDGRVRARIGGIGGWVDGWTGGYLGIDGRMDEWVDGVAGMTRWVDG